MNARALHKYLKIGKDISNWITGRIKKYHFREDVDYIICYETSNAKIGDADYTKLSQAKRSALGIKTEYYLTVNMCKELCTIENNELGRLARRYFILMESIVIKNKDWWNTRNPQRANYKPLCEALSEFTYKICGKAADDVIYAREANILNVIATGCTAQEIKLYLGVGMNELTRDSLQNDYNSKIDFFTETGYYLSRNEHEHSSKGALFNFRI